MILETKRLLLRPWQESDLESLFRYAVHPEVGPICGWAPHKDRDESRWVLQNILMVPETYAMVLKETGEAIGSISLMFGDAGNLTQRKDACELGYWLGHPHWGQGLTTEAARALLRHAFEDLDCREVWCGHYEGNGRSRRVMEKCGFSFEQKIDRVYCRALDVYRVGYTFRLTRAKWEDAVCKS